MNLQLPSGYDVITGDYPSFCADSTVYIYGNVFYDVQLMDSRDPMLPGYATDDEQWDKVNFLLNHYDDVVPNAHWKTLQAAIWFFTDAAPSGPKVTDYIAHDPTAYNTLVTYVAANGAGFNPGVGDWLAVVCIIDGGTQLTFIVVDP
jgi:hypothetical protein